MKIQCKVSSQLFQKLQEHQKNSPEKTLSQTAFEILKTCDQIGSDDSFSSKNSVTVPIYVDQDFYLKFIAKMSQAGEFMESRYARGILTAFFSNGAAVTPAAEKIAS